MKIIEPSYRILTKIDSEKEIKNLELIARTCYKSEDKITEDSAFKLIRSLIRNGHEAMLEHGSFSVKFICDRGVSHELVRHRLASFAQESTRYCNYGKDGEVTFIRPYFFGTKKKNAGENVEERNAWFRAMRVAEDVYLTLVNQLDVPPEWARSVLPNSVKTEVVMTANYREWRHFFKLRAVGTTGRPHPQMEQLTIPLLREVSERIPYVFDDIYEMWLEKQSDTVPTK